MSARERIVEKLSKAEHKVAERIHKVHLYGGVAGMLFFLDTADGHILYGCGVMVMAVIDLWDEVH